MSEMIDLKFKDMPPEETVKKIQSILNSLNIEVEEKWNESGIDHCHSLSVTLRNGYASSNGKGITKELARASAHAEFIERLQQGLHYYKLPALADLPELDLQAYAPDAKYMTMQELEECSDWMDYLIQSYGNNITRKHILKLCKAYACTDNDKILTIPFYSLFEDKYVYMPAAFTTQMYTSNGCCAGNTPEEAIVHAISELFERNCKDKLLLSGSYAPKLEDSLLNQFPTVSKIISQLRDSDNFDVEVFDISYDTEFPVVATRIIDKRNHNYVVNGAADPVLEIALQRTLTEAFQGRSLTSIRSRHNGTIISSLSDIPIGPNIQNMRESSAGIYTADFFCEDDCNHSSREYPNNDKKSNLELLTYALESCKKLNKPLYIRNYSYLGFTCYKVIIPGFSEGFWPHLLESTPEYAMGREASKIFRDVLSAKRQDLMLLVLYSKKVGNYFGVQNNFSRLSGIPIRGSMNYFLSMITLAHIYYTLGKLSEAQTYTESAAQCDFITQQTQEYLSCVSMYLKLKNQGISEDSLLTIVNKFNKQQNADILIRSVSNNESPFKELLIRCNFKSCENCLYRNHCTYETDSNLIKKIGVLYKSYINGQNKTNFPHL